MSAGDVDLVRRLCAARAQGDAALGEFHGPGFVLAPDPLILGRAHAYGSFQEWSDELRDAHPDYVLKAAGVSDLGGGRVLVIGTLWLHGEQGGSGSPEYWIAEVRDGRLVLLRSFLDEEEARRASGLSTDEWSAVSRAARDRPSGGAGGPRAQTLIASGAIDVVRRFIDAFEAGNEEPAELLTSDFEYHADPRFQLEGPRRSITAFLKEVRAEYPDWWAKTNDLVALEDGRVLGLGTSSFVGREHGFGKLVVWMFQLRGGRIARITGFLDLERARVEVGLSAEEWPAAERFTGSVGAPASGSVEQVSADADVVLRMLAARERGDVELREFGCDDFEFIPDPFIVEGPRTYHSYSDWLKRVMEAHAEMSSTVTEVIDLGGGRVLAIGTTTLSGGAAAFGSLISWLFDVRDGRIVLAQSFLEQGVARREAGVSPEGWPETSRYVVGGEGAALPVSRASSAADLLRRALGVAAHEELAATAGDFFAADFEYEPDPSVSVSRPRGSIDDALEDLRSEYPGWCLVVNDVVALADSRALAVGVAWPEGRGEGHRVPASWIFEVREGRFVRLESFLDQERARVAAGLAPEEWPDEGRFAGERAGPLAEIR